MLIVTCVDESNGYADGNQNHCDDYRNNIHDCGKYDDEKFQAERECCGCGGGRRVSKYP